MNKSYGDGGSPRRRIRPVLLGGLVLVVVSIGCLIAFEAIGRSVLRDQIALLADVDHRPVPDGRGINPDGLRTRIAPDELGPDHTVIALLGDSFVWGFDLDADDTLPARLDSILARERPDLDVTVVNFGWISASPLLSLRQVRDVGARYHPDLVVSCVDMTDFHDDLKYGALLEGRRLLAFRTATPVSLVVLRKALADVPPLRALHRPLLGFPARKFFPLLAPLEETRDDMEPTWRHLAATGAFVRDTLGASYAVAVLPRHVQYSDRESPESWEAGEYEALGPYVHEPFRFMAGKASGAGFPVFSLLPDFEATEVFPTCFHDDPHWTPAGAAVAAEALYRHLRDQGMLDALAEG